MSIWLDPRGRRNISLMVNGRRIHRVLPEGASAGDAKRIEAELRESIGRRGVAIPGDPPMTAIMGLYLKHSETLRSAVTARQHALRTGRWLEGYKASQVQQAVAIMVADMRPHYAPATMNRSIGTIKKALTLAWERHLIPENYGLRIKRMREDNARDVTVTLDQAQAIAQKASEPVCAAIWIAIYTGMRRGEILALKPADLTDEAITVRAWNTKTLKTRVVPIVAPLRPWLRFVPLTVNFEGLKSGFRRAREAAGLPHVTFHDLRRSTATIMVQAGVDLYVVSKLLGHSSVAVTAKRYAHLQTDRVREGLEKTFTRAVTRGNASKNEKVA